MESVEPIEEVLNHLHEHVFKTTYHGQKCFVKLNIPSKQNKFHRLQKLIYSLTHISLLAPTLLSTETKVCVFESQKLHKLQALGLNVPKVYSFSENYLIMEDCGKSLPEVIKDNPGQTQHYLELAIRELAKLHHHGQCHGGAQIRNFTVKDGQIYLIDFEEEIKPEYFDGIFFRDIILFLTSIISSGILNFSLPELIEAYEQTSKITIGERLFRLSKLGYLLNPFAKFCGHDVVLINCFFKQIRAICNPHKVQFN